MIENLQAHWGFTTMPFGSAIPVPALFGSAAHNEAVARLRWLISARGLGVLTGDGDELDLARQHSRNVPTLHQAPRRRGE